MCIMGMELKMHFIQIHRFRFYRLTDGHFILVQERRQKLAKAMEFVGDSALVVRSQHKMQTNAVVKMTYFKCGMEFPYMTAKSTRND